MNLVDISRLNHINVASEIATTRSKGVCARAQTVIPLYLATGCEWVTIGRQLDAELICSRLVRKCRDAKYVSAARRERYGDVTWETTGVTSRGTRQTCISQLTANTASAVNNTDTIETASRLARGKYYCESTPVAYVA